MTCCDVSDQVAKDWFRFTFFFCVFVTLQHCMKSATNDTCREKFSCCELRRTVGSHSNLSVQTVIFA